MSYSEGEGMTFYQQLAEVQIGNSSAAIQILSDIELIKGKVIESEITDEEKETFLETLNKVKESTSTLKAENDGILAGNAFYEKVQANNEAVAAFHDRLAIYAERAENVTAIDELNTLKADIEQDTESFETACLTPVTGEYQALEPISPRLAEIAQELEECKAQLQAQADAIDAIITGISTIGNDENEDVIVYTLNGLKQTIKRKELNSLPNGIYIISGKKYVVK